MSDATEDDYSAYLAQQRIELRAETAKRRQALFSKLAKTGNASGGASISQGVALLGEILADYVAVLGEGLHQWTGESLTDAIARNMLVAHLHEVTDEFATRIQASREYGRGDHGSITKSLDQMLESMRAKMDSRVRVIELGVLAKPPIQSVTTNTVTAGTIMGAVMQGGSHASQNATIAINAVAIAEALGELNAQLPGALQAEIAPDADTIRAQLSKSEPNTTILKEAGKSIRTIVEGAVGGALGTAIPAGLPLLLAALGIS